MAQRRDGRHDVEVGLAAGDEVPVRSVEQGREAVAAEVPELVRPQRDRGPDGHRAEDEEQRGEEAAGSARPERPEVDAPRAGEFDEQQRRDQVARQDEERVDTEEAAPRPAVPEVVGDHGQDGYRPEPVEGRLVPKPVAPRPDVFVPAHEPPHCRRGPTGGGASPNARAGFPGVSGRFPGTIWVWLGRRGRNAGTNAGISPWRAKGGTGAARAHARRTSQRAPTRTEARHGAGAGVATGMRSVRGTAGEERSGSPCSPTTRSWTPHPSRVSTSSCSSRPIFVGRRSRWCASSVVTAPG